MTDKDRKEIDRLALDIMDGIGELNYIHKNARKIHEIAQRSGESPRDWTPCAEGLPTEAQEVLFETALQVPATDYFGTYKGFYSDGIFWIDNVMHEKKFGISKQSVIAWQPLSAPWTGGLDGK